MIQIWYHYITVDWVNYELKVNKIYRIRYLLDWVKKENVKTDMVIGGVKTETPAPESWSFKRQILATGETEQENQQKMTWGRATENLLEDKK